MKIYYASDLHLDILNDSKFRFELQNDEESSILALVGDIAHASRYGEFINFFKDISARFSQVIFILGNHEYYEGDWQLVPEEIKSFLSNFPNFTLLNNEKMELDGIQIIGSTLWSFIPENDIGFIRRSLNDYNFISNGKKALTPYTTRNKYHENVEFLKEVLVPKERTLLLLHHAPSYLSVPARFVGDRLNSAFCSKLDDLISITTPEIVIHGHLHDSSNYAINQSRILCNPMGYPGENTSFALKSVEIN